MKLHSAMLLYLAWLPPFTESAGEPLLPAPERVLDGLRVEHPRLLATEADFRRLNELCDAHDRPRQWRESLRIEATKLTAAPPVKYEIPDGKRLLAVSRRAKDRLLLLGLMHRLTGEKQFAERAWVELEAVIGFRDWNPSHFLDAAEMTFAVSIGYDWLFDAWTSEQRAKLREAIVHKGLRQSLSLYRAKRGWTTSVHNWNQVCNGGMAAGALAIAEEEPELSREILHAALHSLPLAMHEFRPDGGWGEGPGYWRYATEYNVYALAALRTALGRDFGLVEMPGMSAAGEFPIHIVGPTGLAFNFADAHEGWSGAPQMFWLATAYDRPAFAAAQMPHAAARPSPLDLLWGAAWLTQEPDRGPLPLARHFRGVEVVAMRNAWADPRAVFVGVKGGDNRVNHGQLDLGSFVLEADGRRWAIDLGPDDYNLAGYFGRERWTYFRNNTHSHNTLVLDGENQSTSARAKITRFASSNEWTGAVADLSAAWPKAKRVARGVALLGGRRVLVQDELEAKEPVEALWQMHTAAAISIDGRQATLALGNERLVARIVSPAAGRWDVREVKISPPQKPLTNVRRLAMILPQPVHEARIVVVFEPAKDSLPSPEIHPLDQWPDESR